MVVAAEDPEITINWQQLTRDGYENEMLVTQPDQALLGIYSDNPNGLSQRFFELDRQYEHYWTMPLGPDELPRCCLSYQARSLFLVLPLEGMCLLAGVLNLHQSSTKIYHPAHCRVNHAHQRWDCAFSKNHLD